MLHSMYIYFFFQTIIFSFKRRILKGMIIYFLDISIVLMSILQGKYNL